jgi:lysozyme family protein
MADFGKAFDETMKFEGGYGNDPQDPGGETYKGVARKMNPTWGGWTVIDLMKAKSAFPRNLDSNTDLQNQIQEFYMVNYWSKVNGDAILDQEIAESIFDFAVNAGTSTSAKLAQIVVGVAPDGVMGPDTLSKLNSYTSREFLAIFAVHKIARYVHICENRVESKKYFYGWVKRTLEGL